MIKKIFHMLLVMLLTVRAHGDPTNIPMSGDGEACESALMILFTRVHLDELLAICANDQCQFSEVEKSWLRILRKLAQDPPLPIFKNNIELGENKFSRQLAENQVWLNHDLLCVAVDQARPYQLSDAVLLWTEILLQGKDIPKASLAIFEFELAEAINKQMQSQFNLL